MKSATYELIRLALRQDETLTQSDRQRFLLLLRNGGQQKEDMQTEPEKLPLIVPRKKVAELLGRTPRTVDNLCKQGILDKRVFEGRKEAAGITRQSLLRMLGRMEPLKSEDIKAKADRFHNGTPRPMVRRTLLQHSGGSQ